MSGVLNLLTMCFTNKMRIEQLFGAGLHAASAAQDPEVDAILERYTACQDLLQQAACQDDSRQASQCRSSAGMAQTTPA